MVVRVYLPLSGLAALTAVAAQSFDPDRKFAEGFQKKAAYITLVTVKNAAA
jgi:hypothetical protein